MQKIPELDTKLSFRGRNIRSKTKRVGLQSGKYYGTRGRQFDYFLGTNRKMDGKTNNREGAKQY